jgi:hypothetical protein
VARSMRSSVTEKPASLTKRVGHFSSVVTRPLHGSPRVRRACPAASLRRRARCEPMSSLSRRCFRTARTRHRRPSADRRSRRTLPGKCPIGRLSSHIGRPVFALQHESLQTPLLAKGVIRNVAEQVAHSFLPYPSLDSFDDGGHASVKFARHIDRKRTLIRQRRRGMAIHNVLKGQGGYFHFIVGPRVPGVTLKLAGNSQVRLAISRAPGIRRCRHSAWTRCCVTPSRCAALAVVIVLAPIN